MVINFLKDEHWWGGIVDDGYRMPLGKDNDLIVEMTPEDQGAFLFVSDKGRYIYSDISHSIHFKKGSIIFEEDSNIEFKDGFKTLKGAHLAAAKKHFELKGKIPNPLFFKIPQFNTWIEFMYNQNEEQIIEYAENIVSSGLHPGIIMIDEGWSEDYGVFDFYPGRFKNPKKMIDRLHDMGFKVMLWVTPNISPDSNAYRELRDTDYLLKNKDGSFAIREWWNGYSCVIDLTNPKAYEWFKTKLQGCAEKYGVDGFKFDAGDWYFYDETDMAFKKETPLEMTSEYNRLGIDFEFNEFRAAWNAKGKPIVSRLCDKRHTWGESGLGVIIPNTIAQGLVGCFYNCPDMIGGGSHASYKETKYSDHELIIRWLEASTFCPMMQFSVAPWRVLDKDEFELVKKYTQLHIDFAETIISLAKNAAINGEPIVRCMEYEFPNQGFETVTDQFMLGSDILVAPVIVQGGRERSVKLPQGKWQDDVGKVYDGEQTVLIEVPLERLLYFKKISN